MLYWYKSTNTDAEGGKIEELMRGGPEDWLEVWHLELLCTKDMKRRSRSS